MQKIISLVTLTREEMNFNSMCSHLVNIETENVNSTIDAIIKMKKNLQDTGVKTLDNGVKTLDNNTILQNLTLHETPIILASTHETSSDIQLEIFDAIRNRNCEYESAAYFECLRPIILPFSYIKKYPCLVNRIISKHRRNSFLSTTKLWPGVRVVNTRNCSIYGIINGDTFRLLNIQSQNDPHSTRLCSLGVANYLNTYNASSSSSSKNTKRTKHEQPNNIVDEKSTIMTIFKPDTENTSIYEDSHAATQSWNHYCKSFDIRLIMKNTKTLDIQTFSYRPVEYCVSCVNEFRFCKNSCNSTVIVLEHFFVPTYITTIYALQGQTINSAIFVFPDLLFNNRKLRGLYVLISRFKNMKNLHIDSKGLASIVKILLNTTAKGNLEVEQHVKEILKRYI